MRKLLIALCLFTSLFACAEPTNLLSSSLLAPKKKQTSAFDKTRILLGPGLGFGAGNRALSFNISPSVAYAFTNDFNAGATLGFNYFQQSEDYTNPVTYLPETYKYKFPAYSFSVFARYLVGNFLILNFEPELNNTKHIDELYYNANGKILERSSRLMVPSVLVGAGYPQRIGNYGYSYLMVCYDLLQNPNARYYQTIDIRAGIMINLWN